MTANIYIQLQMTVSHDHEHLNDREETIMVYHGVTLVSHVHNFQY